MRRCQLVSQPPRRAHRRASAAGHRPGARPRSPPGRAPRPAPAPREGGKIVSRASYCVKIPRFSVNKSVREETVEDGGGVRRACHASTSAQWS
eukprot:scaffold11394_cov151-Isochrysis_galbana.AAC.2